MAFLAGKKILIAGLLSNRSIAYGIAAAMKREGAELAFTYQVDKHEKRVRDLAADFERAMRRRAEMNCGELAVAAHEREQSFSPQRHP